MQNIYTFFQLKNDKPDSEAWIAARFDGHLPKQMRLGDGMLAGGFLNQPLRTDREYRVFVRAYTSDEVTLLATDTGLEGCKTNTINQLVLMNCEVEGTEVFERNDW